MRPLKAYTVFRQAKAAKPRWNLAKTAAQTIAFWMVFLAILPAMIVAIEHQLGVPSFFNERVFLVGALVFTLASCLGLYSGYTMAVAGRGTPLPLDCPRRLVAVGPYAWVRNPMAVAGLTQGFAVGLMAGSWSVLAYAVLGGLLWNRCVRPVEEGHLLDLFGDDFRDYQRQVACWIPRRSDRKPSSSPPA